MKAPAVESRKPHDSLTQAAASRARQGWQEFLQMGSATEGDLRRGIRSVSRPKEAWCREFRRGSAFGIPTPGVFAKECGSY
jgi:hypothetical protein